MILILGERTIPDRQKNIREDLTKATRKMKIDKMGG